MTRADFFSDTIADMNILTEIHRSTGVPRQGRTIHRTAVRGVILRGRNLLMIYSSKVGDYKIPGGGVDQDESHAQALCREIQEECGMSATHIGSEIGAVIEYDVPVEKEFDIFKMTSHYYECAVQDGFGIQRLDAYEQDLGFKPVWIDIDDAIQQNKALLESDKVPDWLRREIFVLEYIQQKIRSTPNI
jgi:8-oxo-dGTP pyrophosphatase MutT (NUDIX family)